MEGLRDEWFPDGQAIVIPLLVAFFAVLFVALLGRSLNAPDENAVPFPEDLVGGSSPVLWLRNSYGNPKEQDIVNKDDKKEELHEGRIYPRSPADGRRLGDPIVPANTSEIDAAISAAEKAQRKWAQSSFASRRQVLRTLLRYIIDHQEEIVIACCRDSGKTKIDACFGEILVTVEKLQWTIKHGEKALCRSSRPTNLLMCYKSNSVVYEPLGVVAACVSWNYPFHNFISPVISALFAGNAIVVKPSEQTCWSTLYFTNIIKDALRICGHDPNLVQNAICLPDVADYLTSHPGISHITFIGSREVAFKVCASAAKALTPVTVELGGKDPAVILDDPQTTRGIDDVVSVVMRGVFQSAGQNCIGIERVIALPGIHDRLLAQVLPKIKSFRVGSVLGSTTSDPPDMGALITSRSFSRLEKLIDSAVAAGATLHCGGKQYHHPEYPDGTYFAPTLLSNVTPEMDIAQTELFGPVFLLMKAKDVDDAIRIANSSPFALGAGVYGHNQTDIDKCVRGVKAGMVAVNDFGAFYAVSLPFGGVGGSGYGRFGGEEGLRALCNVKAVCEDAWWAKLLGIQTRIPPKLQYPVSQHGWEVCKGVVGTGYVQTLSLREWPGWVVGLLRALMRSEGAQAQKSK
ncbi:Meiotic Sister-Chromatid recombination aldehyde dehydrogenase [Cladophialophora chaetospira]|uniref:aldehyde dehydrogenase (NAD(+)) n=1 Tax=Cladophialophora chaetospira TaxID=386627 RepID=A0AA39CHH6_9EURO|nr:Meiotic Sister-Chromatid recombination aldehyde dehydrogenase [Cladophialophora chaetospira]